MGSPDIQLPAAMRSNLLTLQVTQQGMSAAQQRLASGLKVNSALDNPLVFFAARGLTQRAGDLTAMKDAIGQSISTIKAGDKGISSIDSLLQQGRGLTTAALAALGTDDASIRTRKALAAQFDTVMDQINSVAGDAGYGGKNLLAGDGSKLDATPESKLDVRKIKGLTQARVTDITAQDDYRVRVVGNGEISGAAEGIANAEHDLGLSNLAITGLMSTTKGNFNNVEISVTGGPGTDKTVTTSNPPESFTQRFTTTQWAAADTANTLLAFDHTFASGARVQFGLDFDQIDATPQNTGTRSVEIEKHAALAIQVTNGQDLTVTRDLMNPNGQAKLSSGENDFVFPSGTVRLDVDEKKLCTRPDYFDDQWEASAQTTSRGTSPLADIGIPPAEASDCLPVSKTTDFIFYMGLPGSNANGLRDVYVHDVRYDNVTHVTVPNIAVTKYPITLTGNTLNSGTTIYINAEDGNNNAIYTDRNLSTFPLFVSPMSTPGWSGLVTSQPLTVNRVGIARDTPLLESVESSDSGNPLYQSLMSNVATLIPGSIQGFLPGDNTEIQFGWGGMDSGGTGSTTFSAVDGYGRTFNSVVPNVGSNILDVQFPQSGENSAASMKVNFTSNLGTGFGQVTSAGTQSTHIDWNKGTRPIADLKTTLVTAADHAQDMFVAFDANRQNGVTVESQNLQVEGQGLHVDRSQNSWMDRQDIDNAIAGLDTAQQRVRSASQVLTTGLGIITTREDFMEGFSDVLDEGAAKLTLADQNEEGASLLMLQTRQQLGQTTLGMANQSQQSILSLFR